MSAVLIAQLLATFGPSAISLVETLIGNIENNQPVTASQWAQLQASLKQTAADKMKLQLAAANIPLTDPHAAALLALAQ
jgi:hypothetical protein